MDAPAWEPPLAGTETEHLLAALDRQRATFRWKADGLDDDGLALRVGVSSMTLGGLLAHLAAVEDQQSGPKLTGASPTVPWAEPGDDVTGVPAAELYARYDDAVRRWRERVTAFLADGGLDQPAEWNDGQGHHVGVRRLLFDLLEEYARHTGHADLLREAVDGRVGEDPPGDWRPPAESAS